MHISKGYLKLIVCLKEIKGITMHRNILDMKQGRKQLANRKYSMKLLVFILYFCVWFISYTFQLN